MREKEGTMKRDVVHEYAHILVIGFGILIFLYQTEGNYASFMVNQRYRNSEMQTLRYEENRRAVSERRKDQ